MKTIEISDEMHEALMALSKEMNSQDPRGKRMPHMFQIQTEEEVAAYAGHGTEVWIDSEGSRVYDDEDELRKWIEDHIFQNTGTTESKAKGKAAAMDLDELHDYMDEKSDCWKVEVETVHKYQNTFFTAKACEEHMAANHYHYKKPVCYLNHAWRNPEMELVAKFLCELSGGKLHT